MFLLTLLMLMDLISLPYLLWMEPLIFPIILTQALTVLSLPQTLYYPVKVALKNPPGLAYLIHQTPLMILPQNPFLYLQATGRAPHLGLV